MFIFDIFKAVLGVVSMGLSGVYSAIGNIRFNFTENLSLSLDTILLMVITTSLIIVVVFKIINNKGGSKD